MRPVCRHCDRRWVTRPRGLCWNCYYEPGVKDLYPPTSKYARRGVGNGFVARPVAAAATGAAAGSAEKVAVMEARASRGEQLFHPGDNPELMDRPDQPDLRRVGPARRGAYRRRGRGCGDDNPWDQNAVRVLEGG